MNTAVTKLTLILVAGLSLSGCAVFEGFSSQNISGKVLTSGEPEYEGDGCRPYNTFFQYFQDAQVTLTDSTGKILGVSRVERREDFEESPSLGTIEGDDCVFYFNIKDVVVDDSFYTVEFKLGQGQSGGQLSSTVSREDLTGGLVLSY